MTTFASGIERGLSGLDRSRNSLLYFGVLSVLLLLLLVSSGLANWYNEEHYFQLAFRRISPESFTQYHTPFDKSDLRFLFEYIAGYPVAWFGFDRAVIISRIALAFGYAASLTFFFKSFNLSVLEGAAVLIVFHLAGESLIGGEWLFWAVESKTFAYVLVFLAFGLANHGRWRAAVIACAAAAYFHFLVGGFWGLVIVAVYFITVRDGKAAIKDFLVFCLLLSPLFYIIAREQSGGAALTAGGLSVSQIYAAFRLPHHIAPFSLTPPLAGWWPGIVITVCLAVVVAVLVKRGVRSIPMLAGLIGLVEVALALPISWLDRHTFLLSKLYLFRPSSLSLFLVMCGLVRVLKDSLPEGRRQAVNFLLCAGVLVFVSDGIIRQARGQRRVYQPPEFEHLVAAIGALTQPNDIVLIDPKGEDRWLKLHRVINRPTLVAWKFLPTNPAEIIRWYNLLELRKQIYETGCGTTMPDLPIRWLVCTHLDTDPRPTGCGAVVWREGRVGLIQVEK